jgi:hypothetical protein
MAPPFLAQITDAIEAGERLAQKDDRVLFLVTLVLFFVAGGIAVKWFMSQLDRRDQALIAQKTDHDAKIAQLYTELGHVRESFNQYLISNAKDMHMIIARNNDVIDANTKVVAHNTEMSERGAHVLANIEKVLKATPITGHTLPSHQI